MIQILCEESQVHLSPNEVKLSIDQELSSIHQILQECFRYTKTRASALSYFQSLIGQVDRKNSWRLAQHAGFENPYAFQYLLTRAC